MSKNSGPSANKTGKGVICSNEQEVSDTNSDTNFSKNLTTLSVNNNVDEEDTGDQAGFQNDALVNQGLSMTLAATRKRMWREEEKKRVLAGLKPKVQKTTQQLERERELGRERARRYREKHKNIKLGSPYASFEELSEILNDSNSEKGTRGRLLQLKPEDDIFQYFLEAYLAVKGKLKLVNQENNNLFHLNFDQPGLPCFPRCKEKQRQQKVSGKLVTILKEELVSSDYMTREQHLEFYPSFLHSIGHKVQAPHIDYKWESVRTGAPKTGSRTRGFNPMTNFNHQVPLIVLFPISTDGMVVEVWPDQDGNDPVVGKVVFLQLGQILVLRGDVVHAGGFSLGESTCPRVHLYLYRHPGRKHDYPLSNVYQSEAGVSLTCTHIHAESALDFEQYWRQPSGSRVAPKDGRREKKKGAKATIYPNLQQSDESALEGFPLPITALPSGNGVRCKYDSKSRVLLIDFLETSVLIGNHKLALAHLLEKTTITVVCRGLLPNFPNLEEYLKNEQGLLGFGDGPYHKFRRFNKVVKDNLVTYMEQDNFGSMHPTEYFKFLDKHYGRDTDQSFAYKDNKEGSLLTIDDSSEVVFYMIDIEMPTKLKQLDTWYKESFKLKEILPGGDWCVMNPVCINDTTNKPCQTLNC